MVSKFKHDESKIWALMEERMNFMAMVEKNDLGACIKNAEDVRQVKVHFQFLINEELATD
jgi:hypothetical protein